MSVNGPKVLVFQHIPIEHPGVMRDFLRADGVEWTAVELDVGEPIPDLGAYDALWVMGGPMDVWEDGAYPWLESARAERALSSRMFPPPTPASSGTVRRCSVPRPGHGYPLQAGEPAGWLLHN